MKCQVNPRYMEQLYSFYSPFYEYVFGKLLGPGRRKRHACSGRVQLVTPDLSGGKEGKHLVDVVCVDTTMPLC